MRLRYTRLHPPPQKGPRKLPRLPNPSNRLVEISRQMLLRGITRRCHHLDNQHRLPLRPFHILHKQDLHNRHRPQGMQPRRVRLGKYYRNANRMRHPGHDHHPNVNIRRSEKDRFPARALLSARPPHLVTQPADDCVVPVYPHQILAQGLQPRGDRALARRKPYHCVHCDTGVYHRYHPLGHRGGEGVLRVAA